MASEHKEILKTLWPYLLVTALVSASLVLGVLKVVQKSPKSLNQGSIVSFDVVRYSNAQRALASTFLKSSDTDAGVLLMDLSKKTRDSIAVHAAGRLVVLKQALVQADIPDITDAVLTDVSLPLNVPTQNPADYAIDVAPTMFYVNQHKPSASPQPVEKNPELP